MGFWWKLNERTHAKRFVKCLGHGERWVNDSGCGGGGGGGVYHHLPVNTSGVKEVGQVPSDRQTPRPFPCLPAGAKGRRSRRPHPSSQSPGFRRSQPARVPVVKSPSDLWLQPLLSPQASWGLLGQSQCLWLQSVSFSTSFGISWQVSHVTNPVARTSHFQAFHLPLYPAAPLYKSFPRMKSS